MNEVKSLILDLETFPTEAYVWGLFKQNVSLNQIKKPGKIASWAATWEGSDETFFSSVHMTSDRKMLKEIWKLLDEADNVIGWNSNNFDIKLLNAAFVMQGWGPPSPYKKIDLMQESKKNFRFISNKLDFVSGEFGVGHKLEHEGFGLWKKCMDGDEAAWATFEAYNIEDVLLTERMYNVLKPWLSTGVNRSVVAEAVVCPVCGSVHKQARGTALTGSSVFQRYQCMDCGKWFRGNANKLAARPRQDTRGMNIA